MPIMVHVLNNFDTKMMLVQIFQPWVSGVIGDRRHSSTLKSLIHLLSATETFL